MTELSTNLIKEFVKSTHDKPEQKTSRFYGTAQVEDDGIFVLMDGSGVRTPVSMVTDAQTGDRVLVEIVDHSARIIQNLDKSNSDIVGDRIEHDENGIFKELRVGKEYVDTLIAKNITAEGLVADSADIGKLKTDTAKISGRLDANEASIKTLETEKLSATDADLKYANIDFANIGEAAVKKIFADSGIIKDIVVSGGKITGELVGVTIKGDLIEANTLKADKLVVLGEDGLYYKLNVDALGETTASSDPKYQNGLDGSVIIAESITAEKIAVDDLVAFNATIGGFNIGKNSIYSGTKSSINNTTRGIYFDSSGQLYFGDAENFIRFYQSAEDGKYKLQINAESLTFGSGHVDIEEALEEIRNEVTTNLRIESSRGTVFKNDQVSTILSVVIYHGSKRITDSATMKSVFGSGAYLQWKWQRLDEESYGIISSSDTRFMDNGFKFVLNPEDVDTKVTFMCELIV